MNNQDGKVYFVNFGTREVTSVESHQYEGNIDVDSKKDVAPDDMDDELFLTKQFIDEKVETDLTHQADIIEHAKQSMTDYAEEFFENLMLIKTKEDRDTFREAARSQLFTVLEQLKMATSFVNNSEDAFNQFDGDGHSA